MTHTDTPTHHHTFTVGYTDRDGSYARDWGTDAAAARGHVRALRMQGMLADLYEECPADPGEVAAWWDGADLDTRREWAGCGEGEPTTTTTTDTPA